MSSHDLTHASPALEEAARLMNVCNSCRYCEGLCAVFPAMELRRSFADGDLNYLANLCHSCGGCYVDCQFAPPHEFNVNVPQVLAEVRVDSYQSYTWPKAMQPMFNRNGLMISIVTALSMAGFILGFALWHDPNVLFTSTGNFYALMPHTTMASLFMAVSLYSLIALIMGVRNFWQQTSASVNNEHLSGSLWQATKDALSLRYLDGGGVGCYNEDERPADTRRIFHHFTFYGFMLCFAATSTGTIFHYFFDMPAPYNWLQLPKIFGVLGGIGLLIGPPGLLYAKLKRDPAMVDQKRFGMDTAFLAMMFFTGLTGLALMALRLSPAMGVMLAIHLGVVFSLFMTMPYGKFVHGIYRVCALIIHASEQRSHKAASGN